MKLFRELLLLWAVMLTAFSCQKKVPLEDFNSDFSLFQEYIHSFSSGQISAYSDIRVLLAFEKSDWEEQQEVDASLFEIQPKVKGKVIAMQKKLIAFVPDEPLSPHTEYRLTLKLGSLISVPKELSEFRFSVKTFEQDFSVQLLDLQSYSKEYQYLNGHLQTVDKMHPETARKLVQASQGGKSLQVKFSNSKELSTSFHFVVDSIKREVDDSKISIQWNGGPYKINQKGSVDFEIPGKNNFKVIGMEVADENNQSLHINFSDPIKKGQDLNGLVSVENTANPRFSIDGNVLKVFFKEAVKGELLVEVFQGIQSEDGYKMKETFAQKVAFQQLKPGIRFLKNGTILPGSENLKINFEAANLKAVDVKVYKIYQNNVLQFLQNNALNGKRNLRQVASPVAKTTVNLQEKKLSNYSRWNAFALDLAKIIQPEPGAIYRVELSFKKSYSLYECPGGNTDSEDREESSEEVRSNEDYYDYYWYDDYSWQDRQDPCSQRYFDRGPIGMNVLATDLGVIAKRGEAGEYLFAVNHIVTTQPVSGANITLYDFQQQKLTSASTGSEGMAQLKSDRYAYFAIVTKDNQTTYVKMDEGQSLSVSNFDVSGEKLQKGLKGFMYGERGVWRPGDTLFLGFMLNDALNTLDKSHPIQFKLNDPNGKLTYQSTQTYKENNHYKFVVPTKEADITGNWEAIISVGGAKFYKNIKIETIKPNRLKIKNPLGDQLLTSQKVQEATLEVQWLHGAIAKDLKVEMQAKFLPQTTVFKGYDNYRFDDPTRSFQTEEVNLFSGKTNENGQAVVKVQPQTNGRAPGMLKAVFQTKAYEQGGDFSTDVTTTSYSPYPTYIGIKTPETNKYGFLETDKMNRYDIVTLDEKGQPKAVKGLEVRVYQLEWRWWWDAGADDLSNYTTSGSVLPFKRFTVNTDSRGKASVQFKNESSQWGRFLIHVEDMEGGHATGTTVMVDWPYWSGKSRNQQGSDATMLVFSTDKKQYQVGEKAKISFPSSAGGRALLSLENGTRVVQTLWATTKNGETVVEIPITSAMAPNVFVHISLLQPHANTLNDAPIRLYGIVPIDIVDKNTQLEPLIAMPDVLKPEEKVNIRVSEKTGKPMTYTLAIVEDGLLDLTRFKTPNAWKHFYKREALGVRTWDIYDEVIGAYGGKINQIFSIGGDEDLGGAQAKKANRFKPVVMYLGPFTLDKGQTQNHSIQIPNYVGSVRTMVVAGDVKKSAYGSAEKTTPVRKPLMVLASLPRKLSPTEKVTLPVTVFALEPQVKNVTVQLKTPAGMKISGSSTQNLSFSRPDEKMAYFELEVGDKTGPTKVQLIATSGNERATYEVEIEIMNPNPVTQEVEELVLEPGKTINLTLQPFGVPGSNTARLEVSSIPAIDFNKRLAYLIQYPHGCLEQTTSAVFPQLFFNDIADLTDTRKAQIQYNIKSGIQKLAGYQVGNGGFSYWQGQNYADDWSTSYVGHFLMEAERKGFVLPPGTKSRWVAYQQKAAKDWRMRSDSRNDFAQAYRLYTLAVAGSADMASMNRLRETPGLSNESKLRLAAAYAVVGQKQAAQSLLATAVLDSGTQNRYDYFGSPERNLAMALETLLLTEDKARAFNLAQRLAKSLSSDQWMSTQTTAYALLAMSKFALKNGGKGIELNYELSNKKTTIKTAKTMADRELAVGDQKNTLTLTNLKDNTIYVRFMRSGILPVGQEKTAQSKLSATVTYQTRNGQAVVMHKIPQGNEFFAEITLKNTSQELIENVALSHIIPSGFEIVNTRYTDFGSGTTAKVDHTDIRDDRSLFYFSMRAGESKKFKILLNASYPGRYYMPGLQAEAMYDATYLVRSKGQWIEVVKE